MAKNQSIEDEVNLEPEFSNRGSRPENTDNLNFLPQSCITEGRSKCVNKRLRRDRVMALPPRYRKHPKSKTKFLKKKIKTKKFKIIRIFANEVRQYFYIRCKICGKMAEKGHLRNHCEIIKNEVERGHSFDDKIKFLYALGEHIDTKD